MQRRSFLAAMLAAAAAPAIFSGGIERGILMPVKEIWVPDQQIELPRFLTIDLFNKTAAAAARHSLADNEHVAFLHPKLAQRLLMGEVNAQQAYKIVEGEMRLFGATDAASRRVKTLMGV